MSDFRQIPIEAMFQSNSANSYVDTLHPNRVHFRFPDTWTDDVSKNAVIGIRDMYISRAFRKIVFKVEWRLVYTEGEEQHIAETDDVVIEKYFDDGTILKELITAANNTFKNDVQPNDVSSEHGFTEKQLKKINRMQFLLLRFDLGDNDSYLKLESPFNALDESYRKVNQRVYSMQYRISEANDDAINVLNLTSVVGADFTSHQIITRGVWDRLACILYSNLVTSGDNNFLGHTRRYALDQIKYYSVTSSNKAFWVDMYATCGHNVPVVLPPDRKDELYIEAQLLTSNRAVL